jgi:hypothetical protein
VALVAAYLLFAPGIYVLGPLAGLLLLSRPGSLREWLWLGGALMWCGAWLPQAGGLAEQLVRAFGVLSAGLFVALVLWRPQPFLPRAAAALGLAVAAVIAWCLRLGLGWGELQRAVAQELGRSLSAQAAAAGQLGGSFSTEAVELFRQLAADSTSIAALFPGALIVAALAGLALAWDGYHRIAENPLGPAPARLASFGFSDQLVWVLVAAVALQLVPAPPLAGIVGQNLLLVLLVLYAVRGLAVVRTGARSVPPHVAAVLVLVGLFLFAFVAGGLTLLGLADTWLDFRRHLATPPTGGMNR